jgi:hypothetical protein
MNIDSTEKAWTKGEILLTELDAKLTNQKPDQIVRDSFLRDSITSDSIVSTVKVDIKVIMPKSIDRLTQTFNQIKEDWFLKKQELIRLKKSIEKGSPKKYNEAKIAELNSFYANSLEKISNINEELDNLNKVTTSAVDSFENVRNSLQ